MTELLLNRKDKRPVKKPRANSSAKNFFHHAGVSLQRLGKSLMFPIAVLPIAALMNRIGSLMSDPTIGIVENSAVWWIGQFIMAPGAAVFNNIAIIFAIGVAFGLAKDFRGEAALCGGIAYFILALMTQEGMIASLFYNNVLTYDGFKNATNHADELISWKFSQLLYVPKPFQDPRAGANPGDLINSGIYVLNTGVIGGITCGALVAYFYNRFKDIQLPQALAFFGGRRFIPMITVVTTFGLAFIFAAIWPWIQYALIIIGQGISSSTASAAGGAWVYAFINRLLQPFGAHHIINTFLWFQLPIEGSLLPGISEVPGGINLGNGRWIVFGDITAFNAGVIGSGIFQAGFFPTFFGGIPATGLAMIMIADKNKRRETATFIAGTALVAFLTGIDEPLVFIWIFLSPLLLFIHAFLTACFAALVVGMGIRLGFGFSAGLIDYLISVPKSWTMSLQNASSGAKTLANPLWIFPISAVMGVIYYFIWYYVIKKMNIPTPGRTIGPVKAEHNLKTNIAAENAEDLKVIAKAGKGKHNKRASLKEKYDNMAGEIVRLVGKDNFKVIENCATRLRLVVKDNKLDIDEQLKAAGVYQVIRIGQEGLQLVIGTDVEHVTDRIREIVKL
ncbi:PTS transporter subunit EIIC [Spiroplasma chrysopicola]|uniref:PTS system N-acetylglucosamine-specific IIC component n=1 Tax=Spiroplasma chrysopicola DF-1 TaxID=1276227 RepID=R4UIS4_9MOLU|nr:PTS transporter subunit EIIC [Spiroplasma chrysopicola]AGM25206.1 PTS system N-acetylglucosamine-specific IIC component [Spiroplasma chrysopicola DF-1]